MRNHIRHVVLPAFLLFSYFVFLCYAKSEKSPLVVRESEILECAPAKKLSALKIEVQETQSMVMRQVFDWLFPFGPGWNSILGTFYISSVPNFILAVIPAQINPNTLNTMTAFATGGLLSDVFLHLVPHSFMGERQDEGVHFVMVDEKRNILIGLSIFIGFAAFFFMEKTLRVLGGGEDSESFHSHSHSHSHAHSHTPEPVPPKSIKSTSTSISPSENGLRARGNGVNGAIDTDSDEKASDDKHQQEHIQMTSKLSAYLNLFGDFVHNITDGLAMAASFYSSPLIGATTTLACFAHEIPHEIADYSILIRSGFTKRQAMRSQFITAIGAFIGTFMGIAIHNVSTSGQETESSYDLASAIRQDASGWLGTTVKAGDMVIPFVAGGFLYIGAVAVLPTLLAESKSATQAMREFAAMAFGVACMFLVAWNE